MHKVWNWKLLAIPNTKTKNKLTMYFQQDHLWWHWLIKLYMFQMYISMIHHLYVSLCGHHPKSHHLSPCVWSPSSLFPPNALPSGNRRTVAVFVRFRLFICCFRFISYIWVKSNGSWLLFSDLIFRTWYSRDPSLSSQMAVFHLFYGWVVVCCIYVPHLYPALWLFPCLGTMNNAAVQVFSIR